MNTIYSWTGFIVIWFGGGWFAYQIFRGLFWKDFYCALIIFIGNKLNGGYRNEFWSLYILWREFAYQWKSPISGYVTYTEHAFYHLDHCNLWKCYPKWKK